MRLFVKILRPLVVDDDDDDDDGDDGDGGGAVTRQ